MARPKKAFKTTRINISLPNEIREKLNELQLQTNSLSLTDALSRAISFYYAMKKAGMSGSDVVIRSPDGKEKTVLIIE